MDFAIIAHRGDSSAAPENTSAAFDNALEKGFSNFETDCQLTKDGVAIILHDEQLGKTNNGCGAVAEHTLEQLQQLDAGSWFNAAFAGAQIPTLAHILQIYKGRAHIHLELKSKQEQLPAVVAALVKQHAWDTLQQAAAGSQQPAASASSFSVPGLTITSFHLQQLQASKQLLPHVPHGWLIQEVSQDLIDQTVACGFEMLCPRANALTPKATKLITDRGLTVRAWGVKSIELLHHVVRCGAHGATVNWPAAAAETLQQQQRQ